MPARAELPAIPSKPEVAFNRRTFIRSSLATLALRGLPDIPFQTEQKEQEESAIILGQAVTVENSGRVIISNFANGHWEEFDLPLHTTQPGIVKISPDGERVAIWCRTGDAFRPGSQYLFTVDLGNPNPTPQLIYTRGGYAPYGTINWSDNQKWLTLHSGSFSGSELVLLNLENNSVAWKEDSNPTPPTFSPNGLWWTFGTNRGRFVLGLETQSIYRMGTTPPQFAPEVWSSNSKTLAFIWDNVLVTHQPESREVKSKGPAEQVLGFSPYDNLLVYLEFALPPQIVILDLATNKKIRLTNLPGVTQSSEIIFLNTKEFRIVAGDPSDETLTTTTIDAQTGQVKDSKTIKMPYWGSLFTRGNPNNPPRFINPNWVAAYDELQPSGLYAISLETGKIIKIEAATRLRTSEQDSQAFVVANEQKVITKTATYLVREGKRYTVVGKEENQPATIRQQTPLFVPEHIIQGLPEGKRIFVDPQERIIFVPGLTSRVRPGVGVEESGLFIDFQSKVHREPYNYRGEDFITVSWAGFEIRSTNGLYYAKEQGCWDTFSSPEIRADILIDLFIEWLTVHPNDIFVIPTHSEGAQPTLLAINKIRMAKTQDSKFPIDPAKITVVFTHAPILGVDKPGLEGIARAIPWISGDCKLLGIPYPGVANQPVMEYLLKIWENRQQRKKEIEEDINWFRQQGGRAISIGYDRDMVLAFRYSAIPELILDLLLKTGIVSDEPIKTQVLPGGENYMLSTRPRQGLGHEMVWQTGPGLELLLKFIGPQIL